MKRRNPELHFTDLGDMYRAAVRATERSDALDRENQARVDTGGVPDQAAIQKHTNHVAELKAWVDAQDWFAYNGEGKPLVRWPTDAPYFRRRVVRNPTPLKSLAEIARERTADRAAAKGFQSGDTVKVTFPYHQRASMAHLHGQIGTVDRKVRGGGKTSVVVRLADGREAWLGPEHLALFVRPNPRARYFPALNAAGERFHAWQTKGLRKAVALLAGGPAVRRVARRNPAPRFKVGDTVRDTFHGWTTKVLRVDDHGTFTLYLCEVPASHWTSSVTRISSRPGMLDGYGATESHLRAVASAPKRKNPRDRLTEGVPVSESQNNRLQLRKIEDKRAPWVVIDRQEGVMIYSSDSKTKALTAMHRLAAQYPAAGELERREREQQEARQRAANVTEGMRERARMVAAGELVRGPVTAGVQIWLTPEEAARQGYGRQNPRTPEARYAAEIRRIYGSR